MSGELQPLPSTSDSNLAILQERKLLVQKQRAGLKDGKYTVEDIKTEVPEARSCIKTDCRFYSHSLTGGSPCSGCRYLTKGDFYIPVT